MNGEYIFVLKHQYLAHNDNENGTNDKSPKVLRKEILYIENGDV